MHNYSNGYNLKKIKCNQISLYNTTNSIRYFCFSKNKEDNVNTPVLALYIHSNGGMPVVSNLSTPIVVRLPILNVRCTSIGCLQLFV